MTLPSRAASRRRSLRATKAFTLLEILVVLAIIGLLVSLAVVNIDGILGGAREDTAKIFVKQSMKLPLSQYQMHMGDYPSTAEGLQALITPPARAEGRWRGPYLPDGKMPKDPWQRDYQYRYPGTKNKQGYDLFSLGADGVENDNDIGNW
jgi:general secretion pathway protein G